MDPSRSPPRLFDSQDAVPKIFRSRRALAPRTWAETAKQCNAVGERGRARPSATDYTRSCLFVSERRAKLAIRDRELEARTLSSHDHVRSKSSLPKRFSEKRVRGVKFRLNSDLKIELTSSNYYITHDSTVNLFLELIKSLVINTSNKERSRRNNRSEIF